LEELVENSVGRLGEGVYIPFGLQSFRELIAQRLDLLLSAMKIHMARFQVLDLDRPGLELSHIPSTCRHRAKLSPFREK
jgi:hypothetical protein